MRTIPRQRELLDILFDEQKCIAYLQTKGVIYTERRCERCATSMLFKENRKGFRCPKKQCRKEISMWSGSFFSKIKMQCCDVMNIAYFWLCGASHTTLRAIGGHTHKTITAFMSYFRELLGSNVEQNDCVIGGEGITVELDESKVAKRKYNRGHFVAGSWVIGGVERTSAKRLFVVPIENRSAESLKVIIYSHVHRGSIIITDCWKGYDWLDDDENYTHLKVNHSRNFKDPDTGAHTNSIEGTWASLKFNIPKRNRTAEGLDSFILNYIWRRQHKNDLWDAFIQCLADTHYDN
jgi:hypothetical protein